MRTRPFFRKIAFPLIFLVLFEIVLFSAIILSQGLIGELQDNAVTVVNEKAHSRKQNLENTMLHSWMDVKPTVSIINEITEKYLQSASVSVDAVCSGSENAAPLLTELLPVLQETLRSKRTTGVMVILNTEDLEPSMEAGNYQNKQGIYLKNNDPNAKGLSQDQNILMLRSPISVVHSAGIAMDSQWGISFDFADGSIPYYDFFYRPFQTAYRSEGKYHWSDMGGWNVTESWEQGMQKSLTYSIPLVLDDGTVYGVFGVDIALSEIQEMLINSELGGAGTYFLGIYDEASDTYRSVIGQSNNSWILEQSGGVVYADQKNNYLTRENLNIYNNNTPFSAEKWVLAAAAPYKTLNGYVRKLEIVFLIAAVVAVGFSILGSLLLSFRIQKPIAKLAKEMQEKDPSEYIELQKTGITEIDRMTKEIEKLSRDVIDSNQKFSIILKMARTWIVGFQINELEDKLFLTNDFFAIFNRNEIDQSNMTVSQFREIMKELEQYRTDDTTELNLDGSIYQIMTGVKERYVQLKRFEDQGVEYGLAEDITEVLRDRRILAHERDHDALTNLYNRRAFQRKMKQLFTECPEKIRTGALVMIDLDNLKYVNDTYGHEYGDQYIRSAADAMLKTCTGDVYCARISGDEFNIFFYGVEDPDEIRKKVSELQQQLSDARIFLPNGEKRAVMVSGGAAWYPQDSTRLEELEKFADFAMYGVKRSQKGSIAYFDRVRYSEQALQQPNAAALIRLVERREGYYYAMQPIVDAHTGRIYGYEALLRLTGSILKHAGAAIETARREGRLNQIEEFTFLMAMTRYDQLVRTGRISSDSYIFINSLPNQQMGTCVAEEYLMRFRKYLDHVVVELTEEERMDMELFLMKREKQLKVGGMIALDDYGEGYNGENMLLNISPDLIKVDISIIRDIDQNSDKQSLLQNIVRFAHDRSKKIVAEGVETRAELETVIRLDVDYLQGYYLGKPEQEPIRKLSAAVRQEIQNLNRKYGKDSGEDNISAVWTE